jgi:polyphosphate kinase 2 (PPK2 family)
MGFCTPEQHEQFMGTVNIFEKMLVEDGIKIIKFWFSIEISEQKKRLQQRRTDPLYQWKMSTVDAVAQQKWEDYTKYKFKMFDRTATEYSPWIVINGNNKDVARLEAIRYVVNQYEYPEKRNTGVNLEVNPSVISILKNTKT